ncbi:MAG: hypothetical protein NTY57_08345 [Solirubrobacterales bacterium]|nr:hypothetical protein [Solirubrobacterales bacterium]
MQEFLAEFSYNPKFGLEGTAFALYEEYFAQHVARGYMPRVVKCHMPH